MQSPDQSARVDLIKLRLDVAGPIRLKDGRVVAGVVRQYVGGAATVDVIPAYGPMVTIDVEDIDAK